LSQNESLYTGVHFQKTHNFYYENGFSIEYTQQKYLKSKIYIGLIYCTSRLGSAINSFAIKQDNYLFQIGYHFRSNKIVCPVLQLNTGYFYADYGSPIFSDIPHTSILLSVEPGIYINFDYPVKSKVSFGYNFITGKGTSGPGTLFPLYFQCSLFYKINFK